MSTKIKLIDSYKKWEKTGQLPDRGLCNCIVGDHHKTLKKELSPTLDDQVELCDKGYSTVYWGYGERIMDQSTPNQRAYSFDPLRQTIVLLICAMHNEL